MSDDARFEEGDVITFRNNTYKVTRVDVVPTEGRVIQYRLEARSGPPATLEPAGDGYVVKEFHELSDEDITVIA